MNLMVSMLVKPTIILSFALFLSVVWRQASASMRYAIWALALLSALVLPVVELLLPEFDVPLLSAPQTIGASKSPADSVVRSSGVNKPGSIIEPLSTSDVDFAGPVAASSPRNRMTVILALAWLIGFLTVLIRLFLGLRAARRLAKKSVSSAEDWNQLLVELRSQLSVVQPVRVAINGGTLSPVTWGICKSVIVLPSQASQWSSELRRSVLTHELAHVKRHDLLLQIVAQTGCAFYWLNPLFWYAASRLRSEREQACDDYVLNFGASASDYATNLLQIARAGIADRLSGAAMAMADSSQLEGRLLAIMDSGRNRKPLSLFSRTSLLCCVVALTTTVAAVQIIALPVASPPQLFAAALPAEIVKRLAVPPEPGTSHKEQEARASVEPLRETTVLGKQPAVGTGFISPAGALEATEMLSGSQAASASPRFEVVSLKPFQSEGAQRNGGGEFMSVSSCHGADENRPGTSVPLGRCIFQHQNLRALILFAYPSPVRGFLPPEQLAPGGPSWIDSSFFEGEAKAEDPSTATAEQLREMVRTMLTEKFHLVLHKETKDISGYVMVPAKDGVKLKAFPPGTPVPSGMTPEKRPPIGAGTLRGLANVLSQRFHTLVMDKTGIEGSYDFWTLPPAEEWDAVSGSIFSALQDRLGLKLEPQKIPIEIVVIDRAEKPSE